MKLGIIGLPTEESFRMAAEKGLEFLEFCINVGTDPFEVFKDIDAIKTWSRKYNVGIASIGTWAQDRIDSKGQVLEEELKASYMLIDAAAELGCTNYVCGCNYVKELSFYENCTASIAFLTKLIEYARPKGVKIATYNCRWNNFIYDSATWSIIHGNLKELGIKYDPSHCRYDGGDYLKEARDWGKRFYHVHIKGSLIIDGKRFDDPPAGLDQTDWGSFMAVLYAHKYDGGLSIEPHSHNWHGELGDKGVDFTIEYMKKLMFRS